MRLHTNVAMNVLFFLLIFMCSIMYSVATIQSPSCETGTYLLDDNCLPCMVCPQNFFKLVGCTGGGTVDDTICVECPGNGTTSVINANGMEQCDNVKCNNGYSTSSCRIDQIGDGVWLPITSTFNCRCRIGYYEEVQLLF
jgi:hypothetical protein